MKSENAEEANVALVPWDPERYVRKVDPIEVKLSRGFLRSRPEKWFPGFANQWLPLGHSLSVTFKIAEVKPFINIPRGLETCFTGTVDDEPLALYIDEESSRMLLETVCPGALRQARDVALEYMARRLLTTLALCWSGPESSSVRFHTELSSADVVNAGTVKFTVLMNGNPCSVWIVLGQRMVERLDGLWRRQLHATVRQGEKPVAVHFEIAQLAVPPSMLVDYIRTGTVIDLEVPLSDTLALRAMGKPWLPARMANVEGRLALEILPGPVSFPALPQGTTRLSIEFGNINLDPLVIAEMSQPGAMLDSGIELTDRVDMVINDEKVARARLCSFEGRFAVTVE